MEFTEVKSFEDACQVLGMSPELPDLGAVQDEKIRKSTTAFIKLSVIIKALNAGWEPDWTDWNQYKYYPYFYMDSAGLVFAYADGAVAITYTYFGSRLGCKTDAMADYMKDTFRELYIDLLF